MAELATAPDEERSNQSLFEEAELDLDCPSCGAALADDELFELYRLCPRCRRHFWLPARERLALLVDAGGFAETNAELASLDPLTFTDPLPLPDRLAEAHARSGLSDAVITGVAEIGGRGAVVILLDFAYLGGGIGVVAGEKIALAMELAASRRLPLIAVCSGGGPHAQEGLLSLVQLAKLAGAAARLHRAGIPVISILTHPTTGGVYAGLANQADLVFAEPGAQIGFGGTRESTTGAPADAGSAVAELLLARGLVDDVIDRTQWRDLLAALLDLFADRGLARAGAPLPAPAAGALRAYDEAALARHAERPTSADYLRRLLPVFVELHGDRVAGDDPAIVCGLGRLEGVTVAVIAQERGQGEEQRRRRQGRTSPTGYRKATRLMRLAGHLELPLISFVDTPGAMGGAEAEASGIGVALAQSLSLMSVLPVPIVTVIVGEAGSAGALALGVGDRTLMQEHAVYSVGGPESLLYRAGDRLADAAASSKLTARDCLRLGVIDAIVPEPAPAAHADPDQAAHLVRSAIVQALAELSPHGPRRLLDDRARKVRQLGQATPESREAAHLELRELQELQRTISRSLGDLRVRLEQRQLTLPNLPPRPVFPNLRRLNVNRQELAEIAGRLRATVRGQGTGGRGQDGDTGGQP